MLVNGLPAESLTMSALAPELAKLSPPEDALPRQWSTEAHLLASVVDSVTQLSAIYAAAHSKAAPKWEPIQRPTPKRKPTIRRMTQAQRDALRNRTGGHGGD